MLMVRKDYAHYCKEFTYAYSQIPGFRISILYWCQFLWSMHNRTHCLDLLLKQGSSWDMRYVFVLLQNLFIFNKKRSYSYPDSPEKGTVTKNVALYHYCTQIKSSSYHHVFFIILIIDNSSASSYLNDLL